MRITNRDGVEMDVNANHQAETHSTTIKEIQWFSRHKRTAYSAWGRTDTLSAAKVPVLYIKNTSSDKDLIIYKANFQTIAEAATTPAVGIYWSVDLGSVCSGGTAMTPPTIGTTGTETARIYPGVDGTLLSVDDGESIVVAPNGSWLLNYTTTGTAGIASALVFFYMKDVVG